MSLVLAQRMAGDSVEWANQTTLHPLGLAAVVILGCAVLFTPRAWAVVPVILMACFVATAQRLVVGGLDFSLLRIMVLFGWVRIFWRGEYQGFRWQAVDWLIILWAISATVAYTLQHATLAAFINRLGNAYDAVGMYFLFRCLLRTWSDIERIAIAFSIISIPVLLAFMVEYSTGRNGFSIFGGVPEVTQVRAGRMRCQGAFSHPILAGCFWAAVLPLVAARWWSPARHARLFAVIGIAGALGIIVLCASSTPVMAVIFAMLGAGFFLLRNRMRWVCAAAVLAVVALDFAMNKPVYHLMARVNVVGGSTGWHRYHLMDKAFEHFDEWALLGVTSTSHWGHGLQDITNQYLLEGIRGGLITLLLFLVVLFATFAAAGRVRRAAVNRSQEILAWALGVSLFVHATSFLGVSYFGQINVLWYLSLAMPVSLWAAVKQAREAQAFRTHPQPFHGVAAQPTIPPLPIHPGASYP